MKRTKRVQCSEPWGLNCARLTAFVPALFILGLPACRSAMADFYDDLAGNGTGGTAGSGALPSTCDGDPTQLPTIVRDECGVFVNAQAATSGEGTKASPVKTLAEAAKLGKGRIFVCADEYTESETVNLSGGVEVYGGFENCKTDGGWTWNASKKASVYGPADQPVMTLTMGQNKLQGLALVAPDATLPNTSSVAVVVSDGTADFIQVDITAGEGSNGENGVAPGDPTSPGASAPADASNACVTGTVKGGTGASTVCDGVDTSGGKGGDGGKVNSVAGSNGQDGLPALDPNPDNTGKGGVGESIAVCKAGTDGQPGTLGSPGAGGSDKGTLTEVGIVGGDGQDGTPGTPGQGGGGGGGSKAGVFCVDAAMPELGAGASGGGGGAGGCGGKGGTGGRAGGSSIGIVSMGGSLTFEGVIITTKAGGVGGNGALGKGGGAGGDGAKGGMASEFGVSSVGCKGGNGGAGQAGGQGGGGRGGHSIGVAYKGGNVTTTGLTVSLGAPGTGGAGNANANGNGKMGTASETLAF